MNYEDLKNFDTIKIGEEIFKFSVWEDSSGKKACWKSKKYFVYATINFGDVPGIPVSIYTGFDFEDHVGNAKFVGEVSDFSEYRQLCKQLIESVLDKKELEKLVIRKRKHISDHINQILKDEFPTKYWKYLEDIKEML